MNKYKFVDTKSWKGRTVHRIQAIKDFGGVRAGQLGGWIECESNLSHLDNCWVADEAHVYDRAIVVQNARVEGTADVYDSVTVAGRARVQGRATVAGSTRVADAAIIDGAAFVQGEVCLYDHVYVGGQARLSGNIYLADTVIISGEAVIDIRGEQLSIRDRATVRRRAWIMDPTDIQWVGNMGTGLETLTFYRTVDGCGVSRRYFSGTVEEFKAEIVNRYGYTSAQTLHYLKVLDLFGSWFTEKAKSREGKEEHEA